MGFMDKAKKLAEQAQEKLDEAQKNFNQGQSGSQPADQGGTRYDEHGRPAAEETPAAATAPPSATPPPDPTAPIVDPPPPPPRLRPRGEARHRRRQREPRSVQADSAVTERFSRDMRLGGILTAMVTPFDSTGDLNEDATARLVRHLLENGSDGLVLAGSTGEGATMTDEEKVRLWEIGVAESGDAPIIAGTGTYDTRHSVELTERAHEVGVDAMLVVTPYYVRPNRRGIKAHYEAVAAATDRPIVAYNIPSRTATDMPNDLLAELAADIDNVRAVKQARYEDLAPIEGMDLLAGNDDVLAKVMDMGGTGGICVSSNLIAAEMRRIIDEPDRRNEIEDGLRDLYRAMSVTVNPIPVKTAMNMIGLDAGPLRLPLVEASEEERAVIRDALERHNLLAAV